MGIKGIFQEIGPGQRISLSKLAVQTLEDKDRPLRIAIDISIWQFQVQAARGGVNPAIRTLFYRLVRLLGHSVQPVFVFDGPHKPAFKRNRRSTARGGTSGDVVSNAMAKRMIHLFGFHIHDAPGEAEAECALLQRRGIVDAVLSEDVDTIMFGCTRTLRNWSAESGVRSSSNKTPTHVSLYDSDAILAKEPGLDREGMVLVALMSGGDYIPEGVPGCGIKVACQAARAGFGRSLCRIKSSDSNALAEWRETLEAELHENKSNFFGRRRKALVIPTNFPSLEVLRYYTHPVVSQEAALQKLAHTFSSTEPVDVEGLREFVAETFDWTGKAGAVKFVRVLAPGLLVQKTLGPLPSMSSPICAEPLVQAISKSRAHFSTDGITELRVSFIPAAVTGVDLDKEPDESPEAYGRSGLALNSDDEPCEQGPISRPKTVFDPTQPDSIWIPESILKRGVPEAVRAWNEKVTAKAAVATVDKTSKTTRSRRAKEPGVSTGILHQFFPVTKRPSTTATIGDCAVLDSTSPSKLTSLPLRPGAGQQNLPLQKSSKQTKTTSTVRAKAGTGPQELPRSPRKATTQSKPAGTNPWTIANLHSSSSSSSSRIPDRTAKPRPDVAPVTISPSAAAGNQEPIYVSSSPSAGTPSPDPCPPLKQSPVPKLGRSAWAARPRETSPSPSPRRFAALEPSEKQIPRRGQANGRPDSAKPPSFINPYTVIGLSDDDDDDDDRVNGTAAETVPRPEPRARTRRDASSGAAAATFKTQEPPSPPLRDPVFCAATESTATGSPKRATTKLYIPRKSAVGFIRQVEVSREDADRLMREHNLSTGGKSRMYRRSDISFVDLTAPSP